MNCRKKCHESRYCSSIKARSRAAQRARLGDMEIVLAALVSSSSSSSGIAFASDTRLSSWKLSSRSSRDWRSSALRSVDPELEEELEEPEEPEEEVPGRAVDEAELPVREVELSERLTSRCLTETVPSKVLVVSCGYVLVDWLEELYVELELELELELAAILEEVIVESPLSDKWVLSVEPLLSLSAVSSSFWLS